MKDLKIENYKHIPVLLGEVMQYLDPQPNQNFIDATLGGGGYSQAIFNRIQPQGKLLSIDLDKDAVENARIKNQELGIKNWTITQGNFRDIDKIVAHHQFKDIQGIVADIGFSSYQLDQAGRGISFQKKELLDMRFDQSQKENAEFILNNYNEARLRRIFEDYGEEKFARQIAKQVIGLRAKGIQIKYTTDLYQIIQDALPKPVKHRADDSARRIFQALRITVNHELSNLEEFLPKAFDLLAPNGRLAVVSFHSLEDRMVKGYFLRLSKGCVCPLDFPQCICGQTPKAKILTKKPVTASDQELKENIRARPAKLRVIQKI